MRRNYELKRSKIPKVTSAKGSENKSTDGYSKSAIETLEQKISELDKLIYEKVGKAFVKRSQ